MTGAFCFFFPPLQGEGTVGMVVAPPQSQITTIPTPALPLKGREKC